MVGFLFIVDCKQGRPVRAFVMHKCIMVKVGGNEKHKKYAKKHVNFTKPGGKFVKVGGK